MSSQSTFLCECGEVLGRMNRHLRWLPWNSLRGEPIMKGVSCNKCKQGWLWREPSESQHWVDVEKCCKILMCECKI